VGSERGGEDHKGLFPASRYSVLLGIRDADPVARSRAFATLAEAYYRPVYKYLRARWSVTPEDGADLTQEFFATAYEKRYLETHDPSRARFRTFLKVCLDRFAAKQHRSDRAQKRGGAALRLSLDFARAEAELVGSPPPASEQLDAFFNAELAQSLFGLALETLRAHCEAAGKATTYQMFERVAFQHDDDDKPSYAELAREFGVSTSDVTNRLNYARRELRRIVLEKLREITGDEEEFRSEAQAVLGIDVE
jgi:RNA polymerase sigma factor (sigma-70 family)